jgi:hypothetical protein
VSSGLISIILALRMTRILANVGERLQACSRHRVPDQRASGGNGTKAVADRAAIKPLMSDIAMSLLEIVVSGPMR